MMFRGRNPTRRRTKSDQTADGNRSDGERNPIRRLKVFSMSDASR